MPTIKDIEQAFLLQGYYEIEDAVKYNCKINIPFRDLYERRDSFLTMGGLETDELLKTAQSHHSKGEAFYEGARSYGWRAILAALAEGDEETLNTAVKFYLNNFNEGDEKKSSDDAHIKTIHEIMENKQGVLDSVKEVLSHYGLKE